MRKTLWSTQTHFPLSLIFLHRCTRIQFSTQDFWRDTFKIKARIEHETKLPHCFGSSWATVPWWDGPSVLGKEELRPGFPTFSGFPTLPIPWMLVFVSYFFFFFLKKPKLLFICFYFMCFACMYICIYTTWVPGTLWGQKRALDPLNLNLQMVLGIQLGSLRAASTLNYWAVFLALKKTFLIVFVHSVYVKVGGQLIQSSRHRVRTHKSSQYPGTEGEASLVRKLKKKLKHLVFNTNFGWRS